VEEQSVRSRRSAQKISNAKASEIQLKSRNHRADGKKQTQNKRSPAGRSTVANRNHQHRLHPNDLVGLNVILPCHSDDAVHGTIVEALLHDIQDVEKNLELARFKVKIGDKLVEKTYEDVFDNITWPIKDIVDHDGPLGPEDSEFKGSPYNVKVVWGRCGSSCFDPTWESLQTIADGDPASCLRYARRKGLLNTAGWDFLQGDQDSPEDEEDNLSTSHSEYEDQQETNSDADDDESDDNDGENGDENSAGGLDGDIAVAVSQDSALLQFGLPNDQPGDRRSGTEFDTIDLLDD
jgi:hypothetical protein